MRIFHKKVKILARANLYKILIFTSIFKKIVVWGYLIENIYPNLFFHVYNLQFCRSAAGFDMQFLMNIYFLNVNVELSLTLSIHITCNFVSKIWKNTIELNVLRWNCIEKKNLMGNAYWWCINRIMIYLYVCNRKIYIIYIQNKSHYNYKKSCHLTYYYDHLKNHSF